MMQGVRIISLLPSATEIVYALGRGDALVGVTHECDFPLEARSVRRVSASSIPPGADAAEIDRLVSAAAAGGTPTYLLDEAAVAGVRPDVVLTQDLCAVCAVPAGDVRRALDDAGCSATVVSLDAHSLDDVLDDIRRVGDVLDARERADSLVMALRTRLEAVSAAVAGTPTPRVLPLEWGDPPFNGGHWVPEMVETAGAECLLPSRRVDSVRVRWEDIAAADPDVVVFMPCGYDLDRSAAEGRALLDRPEIARARVIAVDGSSYFSRPGPRLVDGVELLASVLHPGLGIDAPAGSVELRPAVAVSPG
jgi:iron complex transport system substrate-binding protein